MTVSDRTVALVTNYTSASESSWATVSGPARGLYRLSVLSTNVYDGKTVAVELRDPDGTDAGSTVTLSTGVTALSASSANQYEVALSDGDQIRLNPSAGGGSMSLNVAVTPLCNGSVTVSA